MKLVIALVVLSIVFALLERKSVWRRERITDFFYWFFTPLVSKTASTVTVFIAIALLAKQHPSSAWFERQSLPVQLIELLILGDLLGYISHRVFHSRLLWKFHAIHHSSEDVDWLSATRVHPVNEILTRLAQVIPLYVLGFRGTPLAAVAPILGFYAIFLHADLRWDFGPLRCAIASPAFHRWHHTSEQEGLDRNFAGLFPWIDLLFGTFYMPRDRRAERFGVVNERLPQTLFAQLAYPFRRSSDALRY